MANQHGYVVEPDREPRAVGIANILSGLVRASRPSSSVRTQPGLLAYRLNTPLLFVNARRLRDGIRAWVRGARPTVRVVLLNLSFTPELDIESVNVLASLRAELAGGEQPVALAVFVLIGSIGVLDPLIVYLVAGARAAEPLDTWRTWAADHNAAVMAVLFLVFGFKLTGDGIAVLF